MIFNNEVHCSRARRGHHGHLIVRFWAQTSIIGAKKVLVEQTRSTLQTMPEQALIQRQTNSNQANAVLQYTSPSHIVGMKRCVHAQNLALLV